MYNLKSHDLIVRVKYPNGTYSKFKMTFNDYLIPDIQFVRGIVSNAITEEIRESFRKTEQEIINSMGVPKKIK